MSDNTDDRPRPETPRENAAVDTSRHDQPAGATDTDGGTAVQTQDSSLSDAVEGASGDDDSRPDPSEVEPLDQDAHIHQRDEHGDLIPEDEVVQVNGQWQAVKHKPATKGFLNRIERKFEGRADPDLEEFDGLLADFYTHPSYTEAEYDDINPDLYLALLIHMVNYVQGDLDDGVASDLEEEVNRRQSDTGN